DNKGDYTMRKLIIAAALVSTGLASPVLARDGAAYVGLHAGVVKPQRLDLEFTNGAVDIANGERLSHKTGYETDAVLGYDLGRFRLEAELAYKHARLERGELAPGAIGAVLLSPVTTTIVPTSSGKSNVLSAMVNA